MPLHPQAQAFLEALAAQNRPSWQELGPEASRVLFASLTELFGEPPAVYRVADQTVAGHIPLRIYTPTKSNEALPGVLYFHGGGWVLGDIATHDTLCRRLANASGCVIISVDYRRAPEHRYPAALEDCYAATCFVAQNAADLGVDANLLMVAGDSAGGNLAAAVALKSRQTGTPALEAQLLIYPVIEPRFDGWSYRNFAEGYGLTRASMIWFWQQYWGDDLDATDELVVPSRATSLSGLPPAHVVTAEFDVLRDEGERFAGLLGAAGVPTNLRRYDGMLHGFVQFSGVFDVGRQAIAEMGSAMRELLQLAR